VVDSRDILRPKSFAGSEPRHWSRLATRGVAVYRHGPDKVRRLRCIERELRRGSAIEPVISRMKTGRYLVRSHSKGVRVTLQTSSSPILAIISVARSPEEGKELKYKGMPALDAGLLAAAHAVEHYEISRYGNLGKRTGSRRRSSCSMQPLRKKRQRTVP
jgi:Domain of unknown function (DUF892)